MELKHTDQDELYLDFETPDPGVSVLLIEEGVDKHYNENTGKTTLPIPLVIDKVIEGPESNLGLRMKHFVPIETTFGEKQVNHILSITNLIASFADKFGGEVDVTDDRFINDLKLKLVGKLIKAEHGKRLDNKGRERATIIRLLPMQSNGDKSVGSIGNSSLNSEVKKEDW